MEYYVNHNIKITELVFMYLLILDIYVYIVNLKLNIF